MTDHAFEGSASAGVVEQRAPSPLLVRALILVLCLIWGSTWIVIAGGLKDLPPMTSLAARFALAAVVFALVAPRLARVEGGGRPPLSLSATHATLILVLPYAVIYWAETRLPSGLVSLLWSTYPVLLAFTSALLLPSERLRPRQWIGLAFGLAGVASMFWTDVRNFGPEAVPTALVLLLSPLASAFGNVLIKGRNAGASSALMNRDGLLLAIVPCALLAFVFERDTDVAWTTPAILSVSYLALFGTVLAFGIYFWLLRHAPAMHLGMIAFGVPLIALTLGVTVGGEEAGVHTLLGMALIFVGVGSILAGRGR